MNNVSLYAHIIPVCLAVVLLIDGFNKGSGKNEIFFKGAESFTGVAILVLTVVDLMLPASEWEWWIWLLLAFGTFAAWLVLRQVAAKYEN